MRTFKTHFPSGYFQLIFFFLCPFLIGFDICMVLPAFYWLMFPWYVFPIPLLLAFLCLYILSVLLYLALLMPYLIFSQPTFYLTFAAVTSFAPM